MDNPHVKHHLRAAAALPIHPMVTIVDRITLIEAKVAKNMQYWNSPKSIERYVIGGYRRSVTWFNSHKMIKHSLWRRDSTREIKFKIDKAL